MQPLVRKNNAWWQILDKTVSEKEAMKPKMGIFFKNGLYIHQPRMRKETCAERCFEVEKWIVFHHRSMFCRLTVPSLVKSVIPITSWTSDVCRSVAVRGRCLTVQILFYIYFEDCILRNLTQTLLMTSHAPLWYETPSEGRINILHTLLCISVLNCTLDFFGTILVKFINYINMEECHMCFDFWSVQ